MANHFESGCCDITFVENIRISFCGCICSTFKILMLMRKNFCVLLMCFCIFLLPSIGFSLPAIQVRSSYNRVRQMNIPSDGNRIRRAFGLPCADTLDNHDTVDTLVRKSCPAVYCPPYAPIASSLSAGNSSNSSESENHFPRKYIFMIAGLLAYAIYRS